MNQKHLSELVSDLGQAHVAKALGVSPAAISKALSAERKILVTVLPTGEMEAQELKPFPSQVRRDVQSVA